MFLILVDKSGAGAFIYDCVTSIWGKFNISTFYLYPNEN